MLLKLTLYNKSNSEIYLPSVKQLNQYDSFGIHKIYDEWPKIAKESYQTEYTLADFDDINHMGTYTINLENGKKLQVSGALMMPWKVIRIDL